jgi:hypothetical protein
MTISLDRDRNGLVLQHIIGGGGRSTNTSIVGPIQLDGTPLPDPVLISDQLNRVVQAIHLGNLSAGVHTVTYALRTSDLGCYRHTTNEAHLDQTGTNGHLAVSTSSMFVNCTTAP